MNISMILLQKTKIGLTSGPLSTETIKKLPSIYFIANEVIFRHRKNITVIIRKMDIARDHR